MFKNNHTLINIKQNGVVKMIKNERLDKIVEILKEVKYSSVDNLAGKLYVSPVTIRRDLKKLEQNGFVSTCYGGVSLIESENTDVPFIIRKNFNNKIKLQLAKEAASLIPNDSTVFLDASSTVSNIVRFLKPEQNVTIVTNGLEALSVAAQKHIKAYSTGGKLVDNSLALIGSVAIQSILSMHSDYMFFSSQGLTTGGIISDQSESETELRRTMLSHANKKYFICDSSKLGKNFLFEVCKVSELDGIICDCPTDFENSKSEYKK